MPPATPTYTVAQAVRPRHFEWAVLDAINSHATELNIDASLISVALTTPAFPRPRRGPVVHCPPEHYGHHAGWP